MSSIDLFLLGFLIDRPWNAYEMVKLIISYNITEMIKISAPAIYKNLIKLTNKGYLTVKTIKEGEMPEKKIYTITQKGKDYFKKLMFGIIEEDVKYYVNQNVCLVNLHHLEKSERNEIINKLMKKLIKKNEMFEHIIPLAKENGASLTGIEVANQIKKLNQAMIDWLENFANEINNKI